MCAVRSSNVNDNKKAELSQRWPRDAPYIWCPEFSSHWVRPQYFHEIFHRLLFRSILRLCVQNLKFVALPFPEIIAGTQKNLGSPWIRPCSLLCRWPLGYEERRCWANSCIHPVTCFLMIWLAVVSQYWGWNCPITSRAILSSLENYHTGGMKNNTFKLRRITDTHKHLTFAGLPGARSEISGPNF